MTAFLAVLLGSPSPLQAREREAHLASYGGWATSKGAVLLGRALAGDAPSGREHHHRLTKLASTAKAFLRHDIEDASVRVTDLTSGKVLVAKADDEGFFDVRVPGPLTPGKHRFRLELEARKYRAPAVEIELDAVDAALPGLLVVSDLDDTLTATGVTGGKLAVAWSTATRGASDMKPYPAAAAALTALAAAGAPVVYLTASPVELAPRIRNFLHTAGFPDGPVLLRYFRRDGITHPARYKRARLERLLADFPERRVILFGDNGEEDPELFRDLANATGRVAAAYVRATLPGKASDARYQGLLLFSHFRDVARDLARRGFIRWWLAQRIYLSEK